jgi:GTP-binding protein Era
MKSGMVTIVGRPNSGKSTLLNSLVGQKVSIVSATPQTTRNRIIGIRNDPRGQVVFVDTPGIHKPHFRLNQRMQHTVTDALHGIDLVLHMVDAAISFGSGENYVLEMVKRLKPRAILVLNKIDRIAKTRLLPLIQRYSSAYEYLEIIPISALTAENLAVLLDRIFDALPESPPLYEEDRVTDRTEKFLSSEFIREKILERTREELPYTSAVLLKKFDESRRTTANLVVIEADILVEKSSQQGIILGKGGLQLRDLGSAARKEIEDLLGCKVYLELNVRTVRQWRDNDAILDELELG